MGRSIATKWIIGLLMYFVVLFFFLSMVNNAITEYSLYDNEVITSSGGGYGLDTLGLCENPRELDEQDGRCKSLIDIGSVYDNTSCEAISGCSWVTKTTWFGWGESTESCEGYINSTYYNAGVNYTFNPFGYFNDDVCTMTNVSSSEGLCNLFGCTWYPDNTFQELEYKKATSSLFGVIGSIVTLRLTFGTTNSAVNSILTFMLVWIPLIILLPVSYTHLTLPTKRIV